MLAPDTPVRNRILRSVPPEIFDRIRRHLTPFPLKAGRVLHHWNMPTEHVFFLEAGLVSVLTKAGPDTAAEVWTVGDDGVAGALVVLGTAVTPYRWMVQIEGSALRMSTPDLRCLMDGLLPFREALCRYLLVVLHQSSQTGACNSSHSLVQRLARCLLLARDRTGKDELALTHDMLSHMLVVRRASITDTVATLEQAGAVKRGRGCIRICDRDKLEELACECYRVIRSQYDRFLRNSARAAEPLAEFVC